MDESKQCTQCGLPMPADAPQGLCPACLLKLGAMGQTEVLDSKAALEADATLDVPADTPATPNVAELAKLFPQLEILGQLGTGGMGTVYKARQKQLDRIVALKLMHPRFSRDPQFAERFNREARALAKLSHPNIVSVFDFGKASDQFYFIMEYVDGANLQQMIGTKTLAAAQALAIVPKLCDALQYAHDEGVVHRDIKPANILVDKKGRVKIADFGLAKIAGVEDGRLTRTNQGMGTMMYMAPEQMENAKSVDHRADIYSLGVVFYEMLTGELPMGRFAPPSEKVQVDVRLDEIVLHAMERDADRRYQHVSEVKTAVEGVTSTPGDLSAKKQSVKSSPSRVIHPGITSASQSSFWRSRKVIAGVWVALPTVVMAVFIFINAKELPAGASWTLIGFGAGVDFFKVACLTVLVLIPISIFWDWWIAKIPFVWKVLRTALYLVLMFSFVWFFLGEKSISGNDISLTIGHPFPWFEAGTVKAFHWEIILASWAWAVFAAGWLSLYAYVESEKFLSSAGNAATTANARKTPPPKNSAAPPAESDAVRRARASWLGRRSNLFRICAPLAVLAAMIVLTIFILSIRIVDANTLSGIYLGWPSPWLEATKTISKGVVGDKVVQVHPFTLSFLFVLLILVSPFLAQYCERVDSLVRYGRRFREILPAIKRKVYWQIGALLTVTIVAPMLIGINASYAIPTRTTMHCEYALSPHSKAYERLAFVLPFYSDKLEGGEHYRRPKEWHLTLGVTIKGEDKPVLMEIDMPSLYTSYFLPKWSEDAPRNVILDFDELNSWLGERCKIDVKAAAVQKEAAELMALLKQLSRQAPANFDEFEVAAQSQLKSFSFRSDFMNFDFDHALSHEFEIYFMAALIFLFVYLIVGYRLKHAAFVLDREVREHGTGVLARQTLPRLSLAALPADLRRRTLWRAGFAGLGFLALAAAVIAWGIQPSRVSETMHYRFAPDSKDFRALTLTCMFENYVREGETYLINSNSMPMELAFTLPDGATHTLTVELPGLHATWLPARGGGTRDVVLDAEELARWMREELHADFTPPPADAKPNDDAADIVAFLKLYATQAPKTADAFAGNLHRFNHFRLEGQTQDTHSYVPFSRVAVVRLFLLLACLCVVLYFVKRAAVRAAVQRTREPEPAQILA